MSEAERGGIETTIRPADLPQGRKFLLGIGIDNYPSAPLRNAVKDLHDMVDVLCDQYDFERENVKLLINEEGTRSNIINTLHSFTNSTRLGVIDSLLIYFSGHGYLDNDNKEGYWVPIDSSPDDIASLIPNEIVQSRIAKMKCRHVLLISDSCFSGSLLAKERYATPKNRLTDELERKESRWIITSGRPDEKVLDATNTNGANSPFAAAMLSELRHNPNAKLLADDLALNVRKNTSSNASQIPQFEKLYGAGDMGGRFVFTLHNPEPGAWQLALSQNTTSAFESFLKDYPQSIHIGEAKERITALINQSAQTKELTPEEQREIFNRLPLPERANRLLDQRIQEWVNNDRENRFLLRFGEWLFIKRNLQTITDWGPNELTKKDLLARSTRKWRSGIAAGIVLLFLGLLGWGWKQSSWGLVWQMTHEVSTLIETSEWEESSLNDATRALIATAQLDKALSVATKLDVSGQADVLPSIAEGFAKLGDTTQAKALLAEAFVINQMNSYYIDNEPMNLITISEGYAKLEDWYMANQVIDYITGKANKLDALYHTLRWWPVRNDAIQKKTLEEEIENEIE